MLRINFKHIIGMVQHELIIRNNYNKIRKSKRRDLANMGNFIRSKLAIKIHWELQFPM